MPTQVSQTRGAIAIAMIDPVRIEFSVFGAGLGQNLSVHYPVSQHFQGLPEKVRVAVQAPLEQQHNVEPFL